MKTVLERFLNYVSIDTTSQENTGTYPSTAPQLELGKLLKNELGEIGLEEVKMDQYGYVTATIPETKPGLPIIGLLAHMDTSNSVSGSGIKPAIVKYTGGDIVLNKEQNIIMKATEFGNLQSFIGQTLVVSDGTTLLGADDKAGIAEIMGAAQMLTADQTIPHGKIRIAFTPDEETGEGTRYFNVNDFGADFAYTVDGGELGEIEYENFNAASAQIAIRGYSIHPGSAKGKMINALNLACELHSLIPACEQPAFTEGYEGFYHLTSIIGGVENCTMKYIVRDHDKEKFLAKKARLEKITAYLNDKYGKGTITLTLEDSYYNMKDIICKNMELIEKAQAAYEECGIQAHIVPIRGGTDGAQLSYNGLPCPNLSTGGYNFHGRYEFIPVESMNKMADVLVKLVSKFA